MTLSVIVPAYNAAAYLGECAASILPQLSQGSTLVIVDDASTDATPDICRRLRDAHPSKVVIAAGGGRGVSAARNLGLTLAESDLVAFCDADDAYAPDALALLCRAFDSDPEVDIASGTFCRRHMPCPDVRVIPELTSGTEALRLMLYQRPGRHESAWAKVYRRSILTGTDGFVEGMRYEDLEIVPRLYLSARRVAHFDTPVYYYRDHPEGFLNNYTPDRADALRAVDSICAAVEGQGSALEAAARSRRFSADFNIFALASIHGDASLAGRCWQRLVANRRSILADGEVRLKNRLGALLTYLSRPLTAAVARRVYR